jgi:hypothetical protein
MEAGVMEAGALELAGGILIMEDTIAHLIMEGITTHITTMVTAMGTISLTTEEEGTQITWPEGARLEVGQIVMLQEGALTPVQK